MQVTALPLVGLFSLLFSGGVVSGLPLGMPPGDVDPAMARVAPDECLLYVSWAGTARPSADSRNRTEQLLADPEVRRFVAELQKQLKGVLEQGAGRGENGQVIAAELPKLLHALATQPTAFFVGRVAIGPQGFDSPAGLLVNVGDQAAELEKSLSRIEDVLTQGQANTVEEEGRMWHQLPTPPGTPAVRWGFVDGYFLVAIGQDTAEQMLARVKADHVPEWLTTVQQRLKVDRQANLTFINIAGMQANARQFLGQQPPELLAAIEKLGLNNVQSLATVCGLDGNGCITRTWLHLDGAPNGVLSPFGAEPLTAADLRPIPADASLAIALRLDSSKAFDQFLKIVQDFEPRAIDEVHRELGRFEEGAGFRVREELLASLGDVWTIYQAPSEGGALFTGWTGVVSVRDAKPLVKIAEIIAANARRVAEDRRARGSRPRFVDVRDYEFEGQKVFFLNFVGDDIAVAPAWCITERELIVSVFPQGVNAYLSRDKDRKSLATVPAVTAQLKAQPAPLALVYYDSPTIFRSVYPLVQMFGNIFCAELQREGVDLNISLLPSQRAIAKYLAPGTTSVTSGDDGVEIVNRRTVPLGADLVSLAVPAFLADVRSSARMTASMGATRPSVVDVINPVRAQRTASVNNLKQIGLAMHNFHDVHRAFPPAAVTNADGKPLLSWRIELLPFLDEAQLFNEFRRDEPWDSPHNKKLIERMPAVFKVPGSKAAAGKTSYVGMRADNSIFPPDKAEGTRIRDIVDGTSNTIMVVEAADDKAVIWTKPDDLDFNSEKPHAGLKGLRSGGFLAVMCDGAVRFLSESIDAETLRNLVTRNDGKVIQLDRPRAPVPTTVDPLPPARRSIPAPIRPAPPTRSAVPQRRLPPAVPRKLRD